MLPKRYSLVYLPV